jgi:hypothetical protein
VPAGTTDAYWWRCYKGHEWKASVRNRTKRGDGCPHCSGRYPIIGETDLATTRPDIALSWHPSFNKDLRPTEVSKGSSKKVWWVCENGHEFQCSVANRTKGVGCAICIKVGLRKLAPRVKSNLNRSLITAITKSLKSEFSGASPFASANTFPTSNILDFPSDSRSQLILNDGEPWEYHHYSFRVAAFTDQWLNTYGALFGTLFVLITVLDHLGFRKFIVKMQNSRVRTANRFLDKLLLKSNTHGLTHKEKIHLERIGRWISKQALDAKYLKGKIEKFKQS